jgi:hypothetical protein
MKQIIKIFLISLLLITPLITKAFDLPDHNFPRLANIYLKTPITPEEANLLSKWDLVILDMQAQTASAENIKLLRKLNPKIVILAYTSSNELPRERLTIIEPNRDGLWSQLVRETDEAWQLKTYQGNNVTYWPGNISMSLYKKNNNGQTYGDYLVNFYQKEVLNTGLWDGIFFDNIWQTVAWINYDIDIDADGQKDSESKIDQLWRQSHNDFFSKLRAEIGNQYLIVGNGHGLYHNYLNGRLFEGFPEYWEGGWTGSMNKYDTVSKNGYSPRFNIINSDTEDTGKQNNYQAMRYGLTSALLYDGYYSFDHGISSRQQFWWYDEYNINLGNPKSASTNPTKTVLKKYSSGVWQREFENGTVLVNSSDESQTIDLNGEYEKIHGIQDTEINNGNRVNTITLNAEDGIILLRPINELLNQVYTNGSFARIFSGQGENIRTGFFTYNSNYRGNIKIIKTDINGNGQIETITADDRKITITGETGIKIKTFFPYGYKYQGGLSISLADLDNDGRKEFVTGTENGSGNLVKTFNWYGKPINTGFNAYNAIWKNLGVNVATGDINGDGIIEIITGPSRRGGPHIRIFDQLGNIKGEFFAYEHNFRGGVNVATADINGDGTDEIVTGPGYNHQPKVKVFNNKGKLLNSWLAYQKTNTGGIKVISSDLDNNNIDEIVALTTNVFTTSFK